VAEVNRFLAAEQGQGSSDDTSVKGANRSSSLTAVQMLHEITKLGTY
jgi:hypothetical protein